MVPILYYFTASFYAARLGSYYNRVLIASQLSETQDMDLIKLRQLWIEELRNISPFYVKMLAQAQGIYQHFFSNLPKINAPQDANEYFDWSLNYLNYIGSTLTLGNANESIYSYAFHMGNIYCNLETLNWSLGLHSIAKEKNMAQHKQIAQSLEEISKSKTKWSAAAINLGNYTEFKELWQIWRTLQNDLEGIELLNAANNEEKYIALSKLLMPNIEAIEAAGKKIFELLQTAK